ncbi:Purine nucleoside phosphoramidase [bioreactor metagenome]|uniref:Purine nucleoside phosphoramidase n=1 Tax=bioreactor metagenome TaxID=1076179 RepID=A0A645CD16_9ZZZZ
MSKVLPVHTLFESETVLAFYHPHPAYPVHVLIVPKKPLKSLMELSAEQAAWMADVLQVAQSLVRQLNLEENGYRLILNGGKYQEVEMLHFHLVSGN